MTSEETLAGELSEPERPRDGSVAGQTLYLDHGATSFPKPREVVEAVTASLTEFGGNPGRGTYELALETARLVRRARRDIAKLLGVTDSRNVLFQPGCTYATNLMLRGLLRPGDRVVVSSMEHNAVARPLNALKRDGVEVVVVDADDTGLLDPDVVEEAVAEAPTRAIVCLHASNLTGTVQPIGDLTDIAHAAGALMLVDGAQAGGHLAVDLEALGVDAWACSGHKGLLGPQGIGLLYLAPGCEAREQVTGGTGAGASELPEHPRERPDRYEPGTLNVPGIAGLGAAARFLLRQGDQQREHERMLTDRLHAGLLELGLRVLGPPPGQARVPIVAAVHPTIAADAIAYALDKRYRIAVRAGLHCAPWAHATVGTLETGAVRFGVGYGLSETDIDTALEAVGTIVKDLS